MCYDDNARPPIPVGAAMPAHGEDVVLTALDGNKLSAYIAKPEKPATAQVVIYPDVRGLHTFYKELALRFAEQGINAAAFDYFGRTAGLTARDDSFEYMPHVMQLQVSSVLDDVQAVLAALPQGVPTVTMGFCMGGTLSFLSGTRDLPLHGVIGFYAGLSRNFGGAGTVLERAPEIKYPALGLFGGNDPGIPAEQIAAFEQGLQQSGVEHQVITYPGATHSFFDRRSAEFAEESADAWTRVFGFITAVAAKTVSQI